MAPTARLAPSPTGLLHIGHARSFLLAWMNSRAQGGRVLLRLEDLDFTRARSEFVDSCIEDLRWLGLDWDEEPLLQSTRQAELMGVATRLVAEGRAYPCICTRKEVRQALSAPHLRDQPQRYPGTCRGRFSTVEEAQLEAGRPPSIRYECPSAVVEVEDLFLGSESFSPAEEFGDFPIASPDGQVSYHLAVVLDDAHQGVSEVLRGDDLFSSCGPQAALQDALGLPRPNWIHVPLVLDEHGERLAKRSDSLSIASLRGEGVRADQLVGWLLRQSGLGDGSPTSPSDALGGYKLSLLGPQAVKVPPNLAEILTRDSIA